ncbi:MAG: division/cell wall cluster transcriptional repressor MraZ [Mycoplasmataceae bacterium]|nr:division/cell wall cluster transcriptional repressor MraZ [Mycoplasmataceae bacterium]
MGESGMLLGKFKHSIDNKNRLVLPAKFLLQLDKTIYLSKGFDGCLEIRNGDEFKKRYEELSKLSENKKDTRDASRVYFMNTQEIKIDSAKRILIPNDLLNAADIKSTVIIIGVGNKVEIWDEKRFNAFEKNITPMYEQIVERLEDKND